jgi:Tol biopolymer transport system component
LARTSRVGNGQQAGRTGNIPGRCTALSGSSRARIRPAVWLLIVVSLATGSMTSCVSAPVQQGVFTVHIESGALKWVGEPAGIPVWSPTDESVAWGSEDGLFLHALDEATPRRLTASPIAGVPAWSPDGQKLAFVDRDRASLVVLAVATGTEQFTQPLDRRGGSNTRFPLLTLGGPTWAPDGSRLAYVCWDGAGDEICVIRADGTNWRQVTRLERPNPGGQSVVQSALAAANTGPPAWSPHGELLAVAVYPERVGGATGVFVVDPDEGIGRRVSSLQPNSVISWAPDGGSILFSAFRRGRSDVFRVVFAENTLQRVTDELPEGSRNPALSSDGALLAVESGGGIVVLGEQHTAQAFSVAGLRSSYPSWSRDGATIAVAATADPIASYN